MSKKKSIYAAFGPRMEILLRQMYLNPKLRTTSFHRIRDLLTEMNSALGCGVDISLRGTANTEREALKRRRRELEDRASEVRLAELTTKQGDMPCSLPVGSGQDILVDQESFAEIVERVRNPRQPTQLLRELLARSG